MVLQAHVEGSSLRGISLTVNLAYNTVVSLVRAVSQKGQMIYNAHVQNINTSQISSDEFWSFVQKKQVRNSGISPECKTHSRHKNTLR
ncbi:MAG: hypothetical protein F6K23_38585 [Okeania sp. SIO2C9]|nr:hypothetical protein [Okeania sp. SIO2C9]